MLRHVWLLPISNILVRREAWLDWLLKELNDELRSCPQVYCVQPCGTSGASYGSGHHVQHHGSLLLSQPKGGLRAPYGLLQVWFFWQGMYKERVQVVYIRIVILCIYIWRHISAYLFICNCYNLWSVCLAFKNPKNNPEAKHLKKTSSQYILWEKLGFFPLNASKTGYMFTLDPPLPISPIASNPNPPCHRCQVLEARSVCALHWWQENRPVPNKRNFTKSRLSDLFEHIFHVG